MGYAQSKPGKTEHVFSGETPVQFGYGLVNSLQSTTESDSTREKSLELQIQHRVAEELTKLKDRENEILKELEKKLSDEDVPDKLPLERSTVVDSISKLSSKLTSQSKAAVDDVAVKKAEGAVVRCLRLNDRRPLDCWKEVEDFKKEVRRLEEQFVGRVVGDF